MTNERIIVAADDFQRIREYSDIVKAHKDEAVRIAREFCPGGRPAMQGLWICPYERVEETTPVGANRRATAGDSAEAARDQDSSEPSSASIPLQGSPMPSLSDTCGA